MPRRNLAMSIGLAILLSVTLVSAIQAEEASLNGLQLYLQAWLPELDDGSTVARERVEIALLSQADLARRGEFRRAQEVLETLEGSPLSARDRVLVALFEREAKWRQYQLVGGGKKPQGVSVLAEIGALGTLPSWKLLERLALEADLDQPAEDDSREDMASAGNGVAPPTVDVGLAARYSLALHQLLVERPSWRREFRVLATDTLRPLDLWLGLSEPDRVISQELEAFDKLGTRVVNEGIISATQHRLVWLLVVGNLAVAAGQVEAARSHFKEAGILASRTGNRRSAAFFLRSEGDAVIGALGSPESLGFDLSWMDPLVDQLAHGAGPQIQWRPTAAEVAAAADLYQRAIDTDRNRYEIALRLGYVSWLRAEGDALEGFKSAALLANTEGRVADGLVAEGIRSLLLDSRESLVRIISLLLANGNFGRALSLVELSKLRGVDLWLVERRADTAVLTVRDITNVLRSRGLNGEVSELLSLLAEMYRTVGVSDAEIGALQESVERGWTYLAELQQVSSAAFKDSGDVTRQLRSPKERQSDYQLRFLMALQRKVFEEGRSYWLEEHAATESAFLALAGELRRSGDEYLERKRQNAFSLATFQSLASRLTCDGVLDDYKNFREEARRLRDRTLWIQLTGAAARCDGETAKAMTEELSREDVAGRLSGFLKELDELKKSDKEVDKGVPWQNVEYFVLTHFMAARAVNAFPLLLRWTEDIEKVVAGDVRISWMIALPRIYRAVALNGLGRPDEASVSLRQVIDDEQVLVRASPELRLLLLEQKLEAEAQRGDALGSLTTWEISRSRQEDLQASQTGVRPFWKLSAEVAGLRRKAALEGHLSSEETERLRTLLEEEARNNAQGEEDEVEIVKRVARLVEAVPAKTNVLVFHVGVDVTTVWRLSGGRVTIARVPHGRDQVLRLTARLRGDLKMPIAGWIDASAELYKVLINPVGGLEEGSTLVFVTPSMLSTVPLEVLGQSPDKILMLSHPTVYADRLLSRRGMDSGSSASHGPPLVVGINGGGVQKAEAEAEKIGHILGVPALIGPRATRARVQAALSSARSVHFATHGMLDPANPYASYLSLWGDDRIAAWELFRDAGHLEMVVFSACNTATAPNLDVALSVDWVRSKSVASIAHGGGARWVVASLWKAEDTGSAEIMETYYSSLAVSPKDVPGALQRAKMVLANGGQLHPFFYSNFVLSVSTVSTLIEESEAEIAKESHR